jgi:hypothetical protein
MTWRSAEHGGVQRIDQVATFVRTAGVRELHKMGSGRHRRLDPRCCLNAIDTDAHTQGEVYHQ